LEATYRDGGRGTPGGRWAFRKGPKSEEAGLLVETAQAKIKTKSESLSAAAVTRKDRVKENDDKWVGRVLVQRGEGKQRGPL